MGYWDDVVKVVNFSNVVVKARVTQEKIRIRQIDARAAVSTPPFNLDASVKAELDSSLDQASFARIGSREELEFGIQHGWVSNALVYVTVTTADEKTPVVVCYNYSPPRGRSVVINKGLNVSRSVMVTEETKDYVTSIPVAKGMHNYAVLAGAGAAMGGLSWMTEDGFRYSQSMITRTIVQK